MEKLEVGKLYYLSSAYSQQDIIPSLGKWIFVTRNCPDDPDNTGESLPNKTLVVYLGEYTIKSLGSLSPWTKETQDYTYLKILLSDGIAYVLDDGFISFEPIK